MKRSPLPPRKKYLARSQKPIPPRRKDPAKRAFAKHRCKPFTDWLKTLPCCVTGKRTGEWHYFFFWEGYPDPCVRIHVDPAHLKTRKTGGDDLYNCIPLARHLHDEQHAIGWPAFEKRYGIDRHALAKQYADEWLATTEGMAWTECHQ